jgi:hypothetical protein
MLDSPFDLLTLAIAIVAFIVALKAMNQVAALRARLDAIGTTAAPARHGGDVQITRLAGSNSRPFSRDFVQDE